MFVNINSDRARRMIDLLARYTRDFVDKALRDYAEAFRLHLLNETIAGSPGTMFIAPSGSKIVVGVQTGNLRRSYSMIEQRGPFVILRANEIIAPYAQDVAENVDAIHGHDFLRVTQHFYESRLKQEMEREWLRLIAAAQSLQPYSYQSPFAVA